MMSEELAEHRELQRPPEEIHLAIVRQVGIEGERVTQHLAAALSAYGFHVERIELSRFIRDGHPDLNDLPRRSFAYYSQHMDEGDHIRRTLGAGTLSIMAIREVRVRRGRYAGPQRGIAYVYDSVMNPAEVEVLRQVYGSRLFVVAIHEDEGERRKRLRSLFSASGSQDVEADLDTVLSRDIGRSVSDRAQLSFERTFHLADLFVDGSLADAGLTHQPPFRGESEHPVVRRFLRQLFSYPHGTATVEELSMAYAFNASLRSGMLARRVGAAIVSASGEVLTLGRNDVPRPLGGLYDGCSSPEEFNDVNYEYLAKSFPVLEDNRVGADSNDLIKIEMLIDLLRRTEESGLADIGGLDDRELKARLLDSPEIQRSQLFELIAYGRTVHAEMDAITTAARLGIGIRGAILFTTTFPCHECARHILATGIREVVFVEPYPKSRLGQLHADAFQLVDDARAAEEDGRVVVRPFVGIAHTRLAELYSMEPRKYDSPETPEKYGAVIEWVPGPDRRLRSSLVGDAVTQPVRLKAERELEDEIVKTLDEAAEGEENSPD